MFFSKKEFHAYMLDQPSTVRVYKRLVLRETNPTDTLTLKEAGVILRKIKNRIADRQLYDGDDGLTLHKWMRPWNVVPKLREFTVPEGDFGVGVEVEMGFTSANAARLVASHIKDWKYITIDEEGGSYPLEVTFAPVLYSKLSTKSQVIRYLTYLGTVQHLVVNHANTRSVGTHVNVSAGGVNMISRPIMDRSYTMNNALERYLTVEQKIKYFGRRPYGYLFPQTTHMEYKLFNSQLDPARLQQYINIAVSLTKLLISAAPITPESCVAACEEGFNKTAKVSKKKVVAAPEIPSLALAA